MISRAFLLTCALAAVISKTNAQTVYSIESGVTSVVFDGAFLASVGLTVDSVVGTTTPAPGFEEGEGFDITAASDFQFQINGSFQPLSGSIQHTGSVILDQAGFGTFAIGDLGITYGTVNPGTFELYDGFLGTRLFELGQPDSTTLIGTNLGFGNSDLFVTPEFAAFLGAGAFAGQLAGQVRVDAVISSSSVPEPQVALLTGIGLSLLVLLRRR